MLEIRRYALPSLALVGLGGCVIEQPLGPGEAQMRALIDEHCQSVSTCACAGELVAEDCTDTLNARWKDRRVAAERMGLTYDAECFETLTAQIQDYDCFWPGGSTPLCGSYCAVFHGDKELGDECEGHDDQVSDCGQGLVCTDGECVDPCTVLGGRLVGEPCGSPEFGAFDDCAAGLTCSWQSGRCQALATQGQSCFDTQCAPGLVCDWRSDTCQPGAGEGQSCFDTQCAEGLYCDWNNGQESCRAYAQEGEICNERPCVGDLWCNDANVCAAEPREGEPCLFGSICAEGYVCDEAFGACVTPPDAGGPCLQGTCNTGSWCDTSAVDEGICALAQPDGERCSGHRQCESNFCPNGFCWPRPLAGESCEGAGVCAAGLVCNGLTCETGYSRTPAACSYTGW